MYYSFYCTIFVIVVHKPKETVSMKIINSQESHSVRPPQADNSDPAFLFHLFSMNKVPEKIQKHIKQL